MDRIVRADIKPENDEFDDNARKEMSATGLNFEKNQNTKSSWYGGRIQQNQRKKRSGEFLNQKSPKQDSRSNQGTRSPPSIDLTQDSRSGHPTPSRDQWSDPSDFIISMIAYTVGLGNVWRFPYLCFKNGGGSFLIVYAIFFTLGAVPIFIMEVTIGQYLQRGAMEIWNMCQLFKGVGIGNLIIAFMCISYFCVICSWSIHYTINSFTSTFPWETCNNWWNDWRCLTSKQNASIASAISANLSKYNLTTQTSTEQYWENRVLMQTQSIGDFGGMQWELLGILTITWIIIYFVLWKGITQARKFVYFCALSPYILITILLARGLTLPGAWSGIKFYLKPNVTKLLEPTVWKDAGTQVFYSYGVGFGTLIALGSHNRFNHNCFRDGFIMCFINGSTSILAGFAVFSVLGYMSVIAKKNIENIVKPGPGLAFLAYPEAVSNLPLKQLWAVLFFVMIAILGLDSQVCLVEGLFTALEDAFPHILRQYKKTAMGFTCLFFFLLGTPMCTYAGTYWLTLIDAYGCSGIALLFIVFFEVVGLSWGLGAERVRQALYEMTGIFLWDTWIYVWKYITPTVTAALFLFCIIKYQPLRYPLGEKFPPWAEAFGFFLSSLSMIAIPCYAFYYIYAKEKDESFSDRLHKGLQPPKNFASGPVQYDQKGEDERIECPT